MASKIALKDAKVGEMGQKYLASGATIGLRLWDNEKPTKDKPATARNYETLGYAVSGAAQYVIEGQTLSLEPGDSWLVPKGGLHTYNVEDKFTALECTYPPPKGHDDKSEEQAVVTHDSTVMKVASKFAPHGQMGQKYLAAGIHVGMRLWQNEKPSAGQPEVAREYEVVGYVLAGKAELTFEGKSITLEKGDSWVVPKGTKHTYKIVEEFTAVECTSPCAFVKGRDSAPQ